MPVADKINLRKYKQLVQSYAHEKAPRAPKFFDMRGNVRRTDAATRRRVRVGTTPGIQERCRPSGCRAPGKSVPARPCRHR